MIVSLLFISSCSQIIKDNDKKNTNVFYKIDTGITNLYLIKGERNILIDNSIEGKEEFIEKELKKYGVKPNNLSLIILTHTHGDHAGNAKYFQEKYNIPIMIGEGDEIMAKNGKNNDLIPTGFLGNVVKPFTDYKYKSFVPDILLKDSFSLKKYGIDGEAIKVGGHTKGSIIVLIGKDAFVGDLIRGGMVFHNQPALHFFHEEKSKSHRILKDIIEKGYENIYPAHWGYLKAKDILDSKVLEN